MSTKAQVWYIDFIIATLIFIIALIIYFTYTTNASQEDSNLLQDLTSDAKMVSNSLVSEGYPTDWNNETVKRIGLTNNDQRLDDEKLRNFINLNYSNSKKLLATVYDYFVFFQDFDNKVLNLSGSCGTGHPQVRANVSNNECIINMSNVSIQHLVKVDRFLIYDKENKSDLSKMVVYVWS